MHFLIFVEREQPVVSFLLCCLLLSYFFAAVPDRLQVTLRIVGLQDEGGLTL